MEENEEDMQTTHQLEFKIINHLDILQIIIVQFDKNDIIAAEVYIDGEDFERKDYLDMKW